MEYFVSLILLHFLISLFEVNDISVNLETKLRMANSVSKFSVLCFGVWFVFNLFL